MINNTYTGPATFVNGSNCTILGNISSSVFRPNVGEIVDPGCPTNFSNTGQIVVGNTSTTNAISNFVPLASNASSSSTNNIANIVTSLPRTGGPVIAVILGTLAAGIIGFIAFKVYKQRVSKVDLVNKK